MLDWIVPGQFLEQNFDAFGWHIAVLEVDFFYLANTFKLGSDISDALKVKCVFGQVKFLKILAFNVGPQLPERGFILQQN